MADKPVSIIQRAHGVTTYHGDVNLAGRDINIQNHYHSYQGTAIDIIGALRAVRNLRKIHLDILSKATPGTGVWLLKTDKFILWIDLDGNLEILWGTGIPGAGKTVLASIVINELETLAAEAGGDICICYVYIRYNESVDLTIRNILEILVKQTVERHSDCETLAKQTYARHIREGTQPSEAELLQLLHQFTQGMKATFYVIDALDEAPDRIQLDLVRKLASLKARLFITSRPLKAVEARFPHAFSFHIVTQEEDLELHISEEIARSPDLQDLLEKAEPSLRDEIVSSIKENCGGMFLHASLQLAAVCRCVSSQDVRDTLQEFPSRIEDVYLRTWERICSQTVRQISLAKAVLVWVLYASRSMTIDILERAVATSPESHKFEPGRLASGNTLMALCHGLVTIDEESRLVRLVHYTARDILQGLLHDSFPHPHSHLATVCMTHLAECGFQSTQLVSAWDFFTTLHLDPLLDYASDSWAFHARQSLDSDVIRRRTAHFVAGSSAFPVCPTPKGFPDFDILQPFHIVTLNNLPLALLDDQGVGSPNITTKILQMTPLMIASQRGHKELVQDLLRQPHTRLNSIDRDGWSALLYAIRYGHEEVVALLIAHPGTYMKSDATSGSGWTPLSLAARWGYEGIVALLLSHPEIEVRESDQNGWSALMLAIAEGHTGTVAILLADRGIEVNWADGDGWTALRVAINRDREDIIPLLLAHPDIEVNSVEEGGWTPLMEAVSGEGHEGPLLLLLAHPRVQVNLVTTDGWSAVTLAARHGHKEFVKLLLAHPDIDLDLDSRVVSSGIWLAAAEGRTKAIELLLAVSNVDVNFADTGGNTIIKMAAEFGKEDVVRVLLELPHINTRIRSNRDGHTALSVAAANGYAGIVQLLQEFEARTVPSDSLDLDLDRVLAGPE